MTAERNEHFLKMHSIKVTDLKMDSRLFNNDIITCSLLYLLRLHQRCPKCNRFSLVQMTLLVRR